MPLLCVWVVYGAPMCVWVTLYDHQSLFSLLYGEPETMLFEGNFF